MSKSLEGFIGSMIRHFKEDHVIRHHFGKSDPRYDVYIDGNWDRYVEAEDGTFHMLFLKRSGFTVKWGKTLKEDPPYCPFGPEIADIEITKMCRGIRDKEGNRAPCGHCYKSNSPSGSYMSFDTFKKIFYKINESKTLTQIAFGVDAEASDVLNPDIWRIFNFCIEGGVTPNVTVADIDEYTAKKLVQRCGAVAVSYYGLVDKNRCYDSVKLLVDEAEKINKNMKINIHCLLSEETYDSVFELLEDRLKDPRLQGMGAIVFLSLKQKGRGVHFNRITEEQYKKIVDTCFEKNISMGFDSCSAPKFLNAIKDRPDRKLLETYVESCESMSYSMYVDASGTFYPCSFMEKEGDWKAGIDLLKIDDFVVEVWYEPRVVKWRDESVKCIECHGCNMCKFYNV